MDPLTRFTAIYGALNAERGWWSEASSLRFAAVAAMASPGPPEAVARAIRGAAEELRKGSRWYGELRSSLRFVVSALLVNAGDDPARFQAEVDRVRGLFRERCLRRSGAYEVIAVLLLRQQARLEPVPEASIARFEAIYEEMKRHHWWLTGPEDFPFCALLAGARGVPRQIGEAMEAVYQALHAEGFSAGDPLQTAAGILALSGIEPRIAARRFRGIADELRQAGVAIWQTDYDELAVLSFLDAAARDVAGRVLRLREEMAALRPKPDRLVTFNLASSVAFLELAGTDPSTKELIDAKALKDIQAVIDAQRAAAAGAAAS
ncbi:MAG: DUF4003 family protein [Planctomycetes bacterium]|nr:DUF4003 family protein [Planctomycetota bacterium]